MSPDVYHPTTWAAYQRLRRLIRPIFAALARTTVHGLENVPATGPLVLTVNHLSLFDAPAVFLTLPRQGVVFMASKHRRNPLISTLARTAGCIWVERGEPDRSALRAALDALKAGLVIGIAPEGTRSPNHALQAAKVGAAYLATRTNVPILPATVWGVEAIRSRMWRGQRTSVSLMYGKPYCLPEDRRARGDALEAYTTEIMCRLAAQLPEKYRGVYADHPRVRDLMEGGG
jgi:1-acyl-sn-glycerol-3-phosphate acyltransferase